MPIYCHIEKLLEKQKMTYQELAKRVDITYVGIWKITRGKTNPSMKVIEKLCRALSCDVGDIFSIKKR